MREDRNMELSSREMEGERWWNDGEGVRTEKEN